MFGGGVPTLAGVPNLAEFWQEHFRDYVAKAEVAKAEEQALAQRQGVVRLEIGDKIFKTTWDVLRGSTYFTSMRDRWSHGCPSFVDRDPTGFAQLLRYLRQGVPSASLPRDDVALFTSVCLEAEFFGVDGLLRHIKARVARNLKPSLDDDARAVAFFDETHGSISAALEKGLLPQRFFEALTPDGPVGNLRIRCGNAYLFLRVRDGADEFVVVKYDDDWRAQIHQELYTSDEELALPLLLGACTRGDTRGNGGAVRSQYCSSIILEQYPPAITRNALGFHAPPLAWEDDLLSAEEVARIYDHPAGASTPEWFGTTCLDYEERGMKMKAIRMLRRVDGGMTKAFGRIELN